MHGQLCHSLQSDSGSLSVQRLILSTLARLTHFYDPRRSCITDLDPTNCLLLISFTLSKALNAQLAQAAESDVLRRKAHAAAIGKLMDSTINEIATQG